MEPLYYQEMDSPLGKIALGAGDDMLLYASFSREEEPDWLRGKTVRKEYNPVLRLAIRELTAYFHGTLRDFTVPVSFSGSEFQMLAWKGLQQIPYGVTISYEELAVNIGRTRACRAVGQANNRNPLAIIVPCHRVIGKNGRLVGYDGGLEKKAWLLQWEKHCLAQGFFSCQT